MKKRTALRLLLAGFALVAALGSAPAGAADACVGYDVNTPVASPDDEVCQPTPLPHQLTDTECGGVPPLNVSFCVWVKVPRL